MDKKRKKFLKQFVPPAPVICGPSRKFKSLELLVKSDAIELEVLDNGVDAGGEIVTTPEELAHELRDIADWLDSVEVPR